MENNNIHLHITTVVKGKILIPKAIRSALNISDGDYILITISGDSFCCRKVEKDRLKLLLSSENDKK